MNSSKPPGERSGEGTQGLWTLIAEDDRRKKPGQGNRVVETSRYRSLRGDVLAHPDAARAPFDDRN